MSRTIVVLIALSAIAVSACSSSGTSTNNNPTASAAASTAIANVAIPAPSPLPSDEEGIVCADLNALVFAGNSADPISTVASATRITVGQVIYAINNDCPKLKTLESDIGE